MKKLYVVLLMLLVCTIAFGKTEFGVKGGLNLNFMHYDSGLATGSSSNPGISFHLGFGMKFPVSQRLFLQPEILLDTYGYDISQDSDNMIVHRGYAISIPVLLRYQFVKTKNIGINVHLGPSVSINLKHEYKITSGGITGEWTTDDYIETLSLAGNIGIGVTFSLYEIELRYIHGLTGFYSDAVDAKGRGVYATFSVWL